LRLGKGSQVNHGLRTFFDLGKTRPEEWVDGEGVTAVFFRASTRSGESFRLKFDWLVLGAIGG
jgi:aspartate carbamoyltransferase catalytic subunit